MDTKGVLTLLNLGWDVGVGGVKDTKVLVLAPRGMGKCRGEGGEGFSRAHYFMRKRQALTGSGELLPERKG